MKFIKTRPKEKRNILDLISVFESLDEFVWSKPCQQKVEPTPTQQSAMDKASLLAFMERFPMNRYEEQRADPSKFMDLLEIHSQILQHSASLSVYDAQRASFSFQHSFPLIK